MENCIPVHRPPILQALRLLLAKAGMLPEADKILLEERFHAIVNKYDNLIEKICFSYAVSAQEMEDLHQDVLINIWQGLPGFRGDSSEKTWIYRVALNTCITTFRKQVLKKTEPMNEDLMGVIDGSYEAQEAAAELRECIEILTPKDKAILLMWLEEMSYDDIAETMGMPRNTIATRLRRAKEKIKEHMDKEVTLN